MTGAGVRPNSLLARWLPVLVWTLLILALSSRPYTTYFRDMEGTPHRVFQRYLQYPVHLAEYAVLGGLWLRALLAGPLTRRGAAWATLSAVALTALLDESVQHLVPTRTFAVRDLVMDGAGGLVVVAASRWLFPVSGPKD